MACWAVLLCTGACIASLDAGEAKRPNIIVILVDDMGFSDIGCYGSEIPTPNLDRLAHEGLRFTQFYNTGRCCPSRAALLTGLYSQQAGIGHMLGDDELPGYRGRLNDQCTTIAEVLRSAGYSTSMTGKWHVGQNHGVVPWERGFDHSLNSPAGGFYFPSPKLKEPHLFLDGQGIDDEDRRLPANWYSTDLWTDFGLRFIDDARTAQKPFFLYLAYNAPHFPLQAPQEEIAKFRGHYKAGWDVLRQQRLERLVDQGIVPADLPLSPRPEAGRAIEGDDGRAVKAWDSLTPAEQDRFDHIMAIYAAVVAHVDTAVGHLVDGLKERHALDDTLIFFMSDNGGNAEGGVDGTTRGAVLGGPGSDVLCGKSWATLENTPLRRYKHFNHEGGIATPLIVHWPAGISDAGALRNQPGHLIDIMTTCVDVAGATYPTLRDGKAVPPMEGRSLVPAFSNKPIQRDALFWSHEGNAAVRVGDMKLVRFGWAGDWELYDMGKDRTEMHDLAAEHPEQVKTLSATWLAWAERANVLIAKPGKGAKQAGKPAGPLPTD
jgi:arylsulfatase